MATTLPSRPHPTIANVFIKLSDFAAKIPKMHKFASDCGVVVRFILLHTLKRESGVNPELCP